LALASIVVLSAARERWSVVKNNHTPKGIAVQTSRYRACIKFGEMSDRDPMTELSRFADAYKTMLP
jgi:hypothetical protein